MAKYRKKPVVIEAVLVEEIVRYIRYAWDSLPSWVDDAIDDGSIVAITDKGFTIKTLEGDYNATFQDWLIRGVKDEIYPCKIDIFALTYELVTDG